MSGECPSSTGHSSCDEDDLRRMTLDGTRQFYVPLEDQHKLDALIDLLETVPITQLVIFVNTQRDVDRVVEKLSAHNVAVSSLHAEMPKDERERPIGMLRSGSSRVLVTTDVVGRKINMQQLGVNAAINFDLPPSAESYLYRIGGQGCFGRKMAAVTLVCGREIERLREFERYFQTRIDELPADFESYFS